MFICGLGTGRCGTKSLAELIKHQEGWFVTHELEPHLGWYDEPDPGQAFRRAPTALYADVAFYYLPHVERLRELFPGIKFVCMQRDRDATVRSFVKSQPNGIEWFEPGEGWCHSFPNITGVDITDRAEQYWHQYYERAESLVGDDFRIFPTTHLSSPEGTLEILTFCGIDSPRTIPCHVR